MLRPQCSLWIVAWGRANTRNLMVGRTRNILPGCHTVFHSPGPLHKLPWSMGRCAATATCSPRADPVLDCTHGECQHWEKGNRRMVRVCKEKSLFLAWINSDNKVNKLTSDSFLQRGFHRQKSDGAVRVYWDRAIWRGKVLCRALKRTWYNFPIGISHPMCRNLQGHSQQRETVSGTALIPCRNWLCCSENLVFF